MSGASVARAERRLRRVLVALRAGPLYLGALELVVGENPRPALRLLQADGLVERASDIGPSTYRLTEAGQEEVRT